MNIQRGTAPPAVQSVSEPSSDLETRRPEEPDSTSAP
jgi:hypothetical protein